MNGKRKLKSLLVAFLACIIGIMPVFAQTTDGFDAVLKSTVKASTPESGDQTERLGDVDLDGKVTLTDAKMILMCALALLNLNNEDSINAADVNRDGNITLVDSNYTLEVALALREEWKKTDYSETLTVEHNTSAIPSLSSTNNSDGTVNVTVSATGDLSQFDFGLIYNSDEATVKNIEYNVDFTSNYNYLKGALKKNSQDQYNYIVIGGIAYDTPEYNGEILTVTYQLNEGVTQSAVSVCRDSAQYKRFIDFHSENPTPIISVIPEKEIEDSCIMTLTESQPTQAPSVTEPATEQTAAPQPTQAPSATEPAADPQPTHIPAVTEPAPDAKPPTPPSITKTQLPLPALTRTPPTNTPVNAAKPQKEDEKNVISSKDAVSQILSLLTETAQKVVEIVSNDAPVLDKTVFDAMLEKAKDIMVAVTNTEFERIYEWTFDKQKLQNTDQGMDLTVTVSDSEETIPDIAKLRKDKNAENIVGISCKQQGALPGSATLKTFVGNYYKDGETLYLYKKAATTNKNADSETKVLADNEEYAIVDKNGIVVKDGYVQFNLSEGSVYLLSTTLLENMPEETVQEKEWSYGDLDGNGTVNLEDAKLALEAALGITKVTSVQKTSADFNQDGSLNLDDANTVLKIALAIISVEEALQPV